MLPVALNIILEQLIQTRAEIAALHVTVGVVASKHGVTPENYLAYQQAAVKQTYDRVAADVLALIRAGLPPAPPHSGVS